MNQQAEMTVVHYAAMVLEWLDLDAKQYHIARSQLVEMFIDTLNALEQYREEED